MPKDPVLDQLIIQLSDQDAIRFRDLTEGGCLITGGLGSGKSSTSARTLALSLLRSGKGGLVLTVKSDETARWVEYCRLTNRIDDLIVFNAASGLSFDFIAYSWSIAGRSAAQIETTVELLTLLTSAGKGRSSSGSEKYFENAVAETMRACLVVLSNADEPISILSIHSMISSLPTTREQIEDEAWQQSSACGRAITKLRERKDAFTESKWDDLDIAITYLMEKWPDLDSRTRSNIESTWSGMSSKFTYDPYRSMFCSGKVDFNPEQTTHEHKVVVLDMPVLEYGKAASRLAQVGVKLFSKMHGCVTNISPAAATEHFCSRMNLPCSCTATSRASIWCAVPQPSLRSASCPTFSTWPPRSSASRHPARGRSAS